jgi:hypothetical protein
MADNDEPKHDCEDVIIITKHSKIIHSIYSKCNTFIKSTHGVLNESN